VTFAWRAMVRPKATRATHRGERFRNPPLLAVRERPEFPSVIDSGRLGVIVCTVGDSNRRRRQCVTITA